MAKYIGKIAGGKYALAISLDKVNVDGLKVGNFNAQIDCGKIRKGLVVVKTHYINCKGKPTLSAVKAYVKEYGLSKYYARWQADSSYWKDDIVELIEYQ